MRREKIKTVAESLHYCFKIQETVINRDLNSALSSLNMSLLITKLFNFCKKQRLLLMKEEPISL